MNKICGKCGINERRNQTSSYCKSCHNIYQKAFYKRNPLSINESAKRRSLEIRKLVIQAKAKPCMDCGIEAPYYVMDLDHRPGTNKRFALSTAASKVYSIKIIIEEISKCDVVCANCHRYRTFSRLNSVKSVS